MLRLGSARLDSQTIAAGFLISKNSQNLDKEMLIRAAVLSWCLLASVTVYAQEPDTYRERIRTASVVTPLASAQFGENYDLYKGELSFNQEDLRLSGNGPDIVVGRTFSVNGGQDIVGPSGFGDWEISIPRLTTKSADGQNWKSGSSYDRCTSSGGLPPNASIFRSQDWWNGVQFTDGSGVTRDLLRRSSQNTSAPGAATSTFVTLTKDQWQFSCLLQTANGEPGQGFLGLAPDGTKYWFDWLVTSDGYTTLNSEGLNGQWYTAKIYKAMLLVTRIEDRFGNFVTYAYDGKRIASITGSDGRSVTFSWNSAGTVSNISAGGRTWGYEWNGASLKKMTYPDGTSTSFSLSPLNSLQTAAPTTDCNSTITESSILDNLPSSSVVTGSITLNSGLKGEFVMGQRLRGRSNVPFSCITAAAGQIDHSLISPYFITNSLVSRKYTGPGVQATWSYQYSAAAPGWSTCASCTRTAAAYETAPDGVVSSYTYSTEWGAFEGKLLSAVTSAAGGGVLRTVAYTYAAADAGPYPSVVGRVPGLLSTTSNQLPSETLTPARVTTVTQDGDTFTSTVNSFDAFAKPLSVTRSSSLGLSTTDTYEYENNTIKWVLGQVRKVTNTGTGLVSSEATYNTDALPVARSAFGRLLHTYTYNANGTLASFSDGASYATKTTNWYRGIPRTMTFADNSAQTAEVNDWGWITSITDALGNKTCYAYDAMGRVSQVTYPSEATTGVCDSSAWSPTTLVFEPVSGTEYGLPGGHWRQTVATGAGNRVTYFDAMWQPLLVREFDAGNVTGTQRFTRFTYDANGQPTFASYPSTSSSPTTGTWTGYDALGRTTSVSIDSDSGPLSTLTTYLSGHRTQTTDPRGLQTTTSFQAYDQPSYDRPTLIVAPEDTRTTINRDVFGKPRSITRSNGDGSVAVTRSYVYQADQQLCKTLEPESGATAYGYDAAGNMTRSAMGLDLQAYGSLSDCQQASAWSSGRVVTRTFDARNRLKTLSFPDGRGDQLWNYAADGLVDQVTTYNATNADTVVNGYSYNHRRLLVSEDMTQAGADTVSMDYGYDANGNLAMHLYPSGLSVAYTPNALGQPTKASAYAKGVSYYPNGAIKQFTYGNGIVHAMTQDGRQLPTRSTDGAVMDMGYGFDADGNVASITDYVDGRQTRSMTYDGLNRLLTTQSVMFGGDNKAAFSYDALDNLKTFKVGTAVNYRYAYNGKQQLETVNDASSGTGLIGIGYDLQGNVINRNGQLFDFDYGNRLRQATNKESYRYDANGRRVLNDSPTQGKIFSLYDQGGVLRRQQDQRTGKTSEYIYLGGSLVARVINAQALPVPTTSVPASSSTGLYTVTWTPTSGTTGYEVQEKVGSAGSWTGIYNGTGTTYTASGKANGAYSYRSRACLYANCSAWSNEATVAVLLVPTSAPSITSPATAVNGNFTVTWGSVSNTTAYKLEQQIGSGTWGEIYSGTDQSKAFTAMAAGSYGYRVRACSSSGCGGYSATTLTTAVYAPGAPAAPTVPGTATSSSYAVSWSAVSGATEYRLEESANGGTWTQVSASSSTSYAASGRASGSYAYRLQACNAAGCSGYSATSTVTVTLAPTVAPTVSAPASSSTGSYSVSWGAVGGATGYELRENSSLIYSGAGNSTSIGGKGNGSYQYTARACNSSGCGPWSAALTTAVNLIPIPAMPSTVTLTIEELGGKPVMLNYSIQWSAVSGAVSYEVQRSTQSGTSQIVYAGGNTVYYFHSTISYLVQVRACNATGCSAWKTAQ